MQKYFVLIILLVNLNALGQKKNDSLYNKQLYIIGNRVGKLSDAVNKIPELEKKLDYQERLNEKTLNSISNQISAASWNLTLFGVLFSIVAVGLGVYITVVERKIVRISEENKELLVKNQNIKNELVELNALIQNDITGLYQKLKREETVSMLDRLLLVPYDVANLLNMLISRELTEDDYSKLSKAYHKLDNERMREDHIDYYIILFFQHFVRNALKDKSIRQDMIECLPAVIDNSYPNDILKSTKEFISTILEIGLSKNGALISRYFEGLSSSKFKDFAEIYQIIFDVLQTRSNRFDFFHLIESLPETRESKINYGQLLLTNYGRYAVKDEEIDAFRHLDQLEKEQRLEEQKRENQEEDDQ